MPYVFQSKGIQHCRDMRKQAWDLVKCAPHIYNFNDCLNRVIEDHRKLIEDEIKMKSKQTD